MKKFDEIQFLEELKKRIAKIDENLHCQVEIISGHPSSAVLCVFPSREKSFNEQLADFSLFATCLLLRATTNFKFLFTEQLPKARLTLKVLQS